MTPLLLLPFPYHPNHRGTETAKDWETDFNYREILGRYVSNMKLPGRVHSGFATVAASLWPGIKEALHSLVKDQSSGTAIKHVYVAGHSLGAAVSTLIAYRAQVRGHAGHAVWDTIHRLCQTVTVSSNAFALARSAKPHHNEEVGIADTPQRHLRTSARHNTKQPAAEAQPEQWMPVICMLLSWPGSDGRNLASARECL